MNSTAYISFTSPITPQTAPQLVAACAVHANAGGTKLVLALATQGGSVDDSIMIYNSLSALPLELITFNIGAVNSAGIVIFLAGDMRYAAPSATFLFHGSSADMTAPFKLDEKTCRNILESLETSHRKIRDIICSRTSIDAKEAKSLFLGQATKNTEFALEKNIINDVEQFVIPKGAQFQQLVFGQI